MSIQENVLKMPAKWWPCCLDRNLLTFACLFTLLFVVGLNNFSRVETKPKMCQINHISNYGCNILGSRHEDITESASVRIQMIHVQVIHPEEIKPMNDKTHI